MEDSGDVEVLLARLEEQRAAVANTAELLAQSLVSASQRDATASSTRGGDANEPRSPPHSPRPSVVTYATGERSRDPKDLRKHSAGLVTLDTTSASRSTGHDSDSDDDKDESYYAQVPLKPHSHDHDGLRAHLRTYKWHRQSEKVLQDVLDDPKFLSQPTLFHTLPGPARDRSHLSHYEVFDVGSDGAPLPVEVPESVSPSKALMIWNAIKEINQSGKERQAVGRITIVQEPSPILFGALHHTMHKYFDMDELFSNLVSIGRSSVELFRAYDADERRRRTFVFNFEYFTIVGADCRPMPWQMADRQKDRKGHHIPITRCSSVVALALGGEPIRKIKNRSRRKTTAFGYAYDPFAPWQVLNIQCYPDWVSADNPHEPSKNYVNGVEAFLVTLLGEFRDAIKRFEKIYETISELMTPPLEFMFNSEVRDKLLFEDKDFTYSRRYFWGWQTLDIINDSIKGIVDAYEDNFTEEVWEGKNKTLWPLLDEDSPKNAYFRKRMAVLRKKFAFEIKRLRTQMAENEEKRTDIKGLREELFVGTSIQESRKSVENTEIAIQQGHNIKLLTLVSIFFLPLTFVTSVFGMTNMPTEQHYWMFTIVIVTVCVPFFVLIGSLNTIRGMRFWRSKFVLLFKYIGALFVWAGSGFKHWPVNEKVDPDTGPNHGTSPITRLTTMDKGASTLRLRRWLSAQSALDSPNGIEIPGIARSAKPRPYFWQRKSSRLVEMWTEESTRPKHLG